MVQRETIPEKTLKCTNIGLQQDGINCCVPMPQQRFKPSRKITVKVPPSSPTQGETGPISYQLSSPSPVAPAEAHVYDIDKEYTYIMGKALKSYKNHREKEIVETKVRAMSAGTERPEPTQVYRFPKRPSTAKAKIARQGPRPLGTVPDQEVLFNRGDTAPNRSISRKLIHLNPTIMSLPNMHEIHRYNHVRSATFQPNYKNNGGVFSPRRYKMEYFTIHPEWVSENLTIQRLNLQEKKKNTGKDVTDSSRKAWTLPNRRCRSAPPPRSRNIITWQ